MKHLAYFLAAAAVLAAAACGSTPAGGTAGSTTTPTQAPHSTAAQIPSNGVDKMSPAQATRTAVSALSAARTVRLQGSGTSEGKHVWVDLHVSSTGTGGTIASNGAAFQVIIIGKDFFMKGPARAWKAAGTPEGVATLVGGRWVKVPGIAEEMHMFTVAAFSTEMLHVAPLSRSVSRATLNGRDVVLIRYADGSRLYVCRTGTPYPLRYISSDADGGQVSFSEFSAAVHVVAPKGAIDMTKVS